MDDSQTNVENTDHGPDKQIKTDQQSPADRAKAFVRANARNEYDYLKDRLSEQIKLRNANKGDLPDFVMVGTQTVQLGHVRLTLHLEQLYSNPDTYILNFGLGSASAKATMFGPGPRAESGKMRATTSHDVRVLLWSSDQLGSLESEAVVEYLLYRLTDYYVRHTPK